MISEPNQTIIPLNESANQTIASSFFIYKYSVLAFVPTGGTWRATLQMGVDSIHKLGRER